MGTIVVFAIIIILIFIVLIIITICQNTEFQYELSKLTHLKTYHSKTSPGFCSLVQLRFSFHKTNLEFWDVIKSEIISDGSNNNAGQFLMITSSFHVFHLVVKNKRQLLFPLLTNEKT